MCDGIKKNRCSWVSDKELYLKYHDEEWGVPIYDDKKLFEFLTLEGAQAGLNWYTVLLKRENYRESFDGFDVKKIARYDEDKILKLLDNPGIIRNKLKVRSVVSNAQKFINIQNEYGSFSKFIWKFVGGKPVINAWESLSEVPSLTKQSDKMSKELKKLGFKFIGTTICYAFMQAAGMVNDHEKSCFRYSELK